MNESEIKRILPRASKGFVALNVGADGLSSRAKPKSTFRDESLAADKGKAKDATRRIVRVTSLRARLLDFDNICPKFFIDALRYAGCIHDDTEKDIDLRISQRKVAKKAQEKTLIEVT